MYPVWKASRRVQLIYKIIFITIINLATNGGFSQDLHNLSKRTNKQAAIIGTDPLSQSKASTNPLLLSSHIADTNGSVHLNCMNMKLQWILHL